ncbi:MAG: GIY-YIG nuclease family protein [Chlorobiaceae bacterium]|nr:GIY-YIG nuclease family protein [Chlorobiaceae bacterium]
MHYTIFGQIYRQGSYLLLIDLKKRVDVSFGKFRNGQPIDFYPGYYLYVGSALGNKGFPLASRVLRHASRSDECCPHAIRATLSALFTSWRYQPPAGERHKKLHWHIDYLLDRTEAEIIHAFLFPGPERIETQLASLLASMPDTSIVADRLGAQDAASGTHLFRITEPEALLPALQTALPTISDDK